MGGSGGQADLLFWYMDRYNCGKVDFKQFATGILLVSPASMLCCCWGIARHATRNSFARALWVCWFAVVREQPLPGQGSLQTFSLTVDDDVQTYAVDHLFRVLPQLDLISTCARARAADAFSDGLRRIPDSLQCLSLIHI